LVSEEPLAPEAQALRAVPAAGAVDRALAAVALAGARLQGWRPASEGEDAAISVLCLARPVSTQRLRRAVALASGAGAPSFGFALEDAAATQLSAAIRPVPVLRGLDALLARLPAGGGVPARKAADEPAATPEPPGFALPA
jgi:hypothetical protein